MSFSILVVVGYWYKGLEGILPFHLKEILVFYYEQFIKQFFFLGEIKSFADANEYVVFYFKDEFDFRISP